MRYDVMINVRRPRSIGCPATFREFVEARNEVEAITAVAEIAALNGWDYVHPRFCEIVEEAP